jgi:SAM-dependent methyltransferase
MKKSGVRGKRILSLGCGNAVAEMILARRGYQVTGMDSSREMLREARRLSAESGRPLKLVRGDIRGDLPKAVYDLVYSHYYTINYITSVSGLRTCFGHVFHGLVSGGIFVFDTKRFTDDPSGAGPPRAEAFYYGHDRLHTIRIKKTLRNGVVENEFINFFAVGKKGLYELARETHRQRFYRAGEILGALTWAGFESSGISLYRYLSFSPAVEASERVVYVCSKP